MAIAQNTRNPSAQPATTDRAPPRRRSFLTALTAAVATPAVVASATIAKAAPAAQEVPEILEIGQRLPALVQAVRAAETRKAEARATYERLNPPVPERLVVDLRQPITYLAEDERDVDNQLVAHNGRFPPRRIYQWRIIKAHMIRWDISADTEDGKQLRKLARIARKYESDVAAAVRQSGYLERRKDLADANEQVDEQVDRLLELEPTTMAGVMVYARAIAAIRESGALDQADHLAGAVVDALLRIGADQAS